MQEDFNIQEYLARSVENIVKDSIKATLKNPKEALFLAGFAKSTRKATKTREEYLKQDINIPAFLIASITADCNLNCVGCYSRTNNDHHQIPLSDSQWEDIFRQSRDLGISFIVLAGGEPMMREDVLLKASNFPEILFPVFTNGTLLNGNYLELFDGNRNLIPVLSIEGDREVTDSRRGEGVYSQVTDSMQLMKDNDLIFGASVTVTKDNLNYAVSEEFINLLKSSGCKVLFFIEFVPVDGNANLAPSDEERELLMEEIADLREKHPEMLFMSFPGDEKSTGGCLAAGRGFFHINYHGGAEPCPASPYSDINVRDATILEVLDSGFFKSLREDGILTEDHDGGCVLFEHKKEVESLLNH